MHIEINAGGLGGSIAIAEYQSNMSSFISDAESMISSFKAISSSAYALNGGINKNPVEVTKINDSFYYYNGDGRHRIIAAQELNIDIPVIIKGLYTK